MIRQFLISILILGALSSCTRNLSPEVMKDSNWELEQWTNRDLPVEAKATLKIENEKISGQSFCNSYFGTAVFNGNSLKLNPTGSTKMFCVQTNQAESNFILDLKKVNAGSLKGSRLVLRKDDQIIFVFKKATLKAH